MAMIRRLLALLAATLALAGCSASSDQRDWPAPSPALWRITDAAGHEGWLLGTVHALPEGATWHSPAIDAALDQAGVLVVEVANLTDDQAAAAAFQMRANATGLPPLLSRVPAAQRDEVAALLDRAGHSEGDFAQTKTWAAAMQLAGGVRLGDPMLGVDRELVGRGLPVAGLEGFDAQFALFDALPAPDQADLLVAVAREGDAPDPARELEAWLTGDMATLETGAFAGMLADPGLRVFLLDARNQAWVEPVIARLTAGERPFVAVGAVHMLGPQGLPALLAARGITVQRIQ